LKPGNNNKIYHLEKVMEQNDNTPQKPSLVIAEPVLVVKDVALTIKYWQETLCFPDRWMWGTPPNHGGVSWDGTGVQFSLNPAHSEISRENCIWIRVRHLESLYKLHQKNGAEIVDPLRNKEYGMADYIVREINGHYIIFAGHITETEKSADKLPASVRIVARKLIPIESRHLSQSVGWSDKTDNSEPIPSPANIIFSVVAENTITNEAIGSALLIGDNYKSFYVKDVMVHPDWQRKRVGTALMQAITDWLEVNAPDNSTVTLITSDNLSAFYKQFGFSSAHGMIKWIHKK
jgi:hypothetical protein